MQDGRLSSNVAVALCEQMEIGILAINPSISLRVCTLSRSSTPTCLGATEAHPTAATTTKFSALALEITAWGRQAPGKNGLDGEIALRV